MFKKIKNYFRERKENKFFESAFFNDKYPIDGEDLGSVK